MSLFHVDGPDRVDILIAETDASTRSQLRRLLDREGYHCEEAGTRREAVAKAQRHRPHCVLLDLVARDDIEIARRLRADPRTHAAHIHCLSTLSDDNIPIQAAIAGCDSVIRKPVDETELLEIVSRELGSPQEWAHGLTREEAENLLDWLELQGALHGVPGQVRLEKEGTFAVRCPGFRAVRDAHGQLMVVRPEALMNDRPSRHSSCDRRAR